MCGVCGCGAGEARIEGHAHTHSHGHAHHHHGDGHAHHSHAHGTDPARMVQIEQDILGENDRFAAGNRDWLAAREAVALNLVSSPGSGKTTLLVETLQRLAGRRPAVVIEGDQETANDAERIRATGVQALQINTGKGCHLDAHLVGHALEQLDPPLGALALIENVGNLVCPAAFDLGEQHRVAILSVTEGEDKPLKYPQLFESSDVLVLNKVDLLPHLDFDVEACLANARRVNPALRVFRTSARSGEGMDAWCDWLFALQPARVAESA